ncbi:hypothetical protein FISHEDRAFT_75298 [Fistulina hepatica ATCC 64428]|uniref:WSC domain-containing protein n=1 Tax=Fistulina hepatica ATCC 64428 TaxID=1128425 RepID=A0A0D7A6X1_9AGAR|nr:hypothetical protein FISHEDRAFT_75298 [Fistulina hepatica ATCC 64428]
MPADSSLWEDISEFQKRDGTKYVFIHHIVGNTYNYTVDTWKSDIAAIQSKRIDAIALNYGSDYWETTQLTNAYTAASELGTDMKLFLSLDFSSLDCSTSTSISTINTYASHTNQFTVNGKPLISSFSGSCLGNSGWASIKSSTNGYLMPFLSGLEGSFSSWTSLDSWLCWDCAWPSGDTDANLDTDDYYMSDQGLGTKFATTVSPWFFTHYSSKNWYYRGDDFLFNKRWDLLIGIRSELTFVEMLTWNDYGESHYMGPIDGEAPTGTYWIYGFPHAAWFDMSEYYITAFKTGAYPSITQDVIYFWARPHPALAIATSDSLGHPSNYTDAIDAVWAAVFATSTGTVTLKSGTNTASYSVTSGVNTVTVAQATGTMAVNMVRNGQTIINYTPTGFTFVATPTSYNYNAWVGAATATSVSTSSTSTSTSTTTTRTTSTTTTTTSTSSSSIATSSGYTLLGCIKDSSSARAVVGKAISSTSMTIGYCASQCAGYTYFGVDYQCFCGNSYTSNGNTGTFVSTSYCSTACYANSSQLCGGTGYMDLYQLTVSATTSTSTSTSAAYTSTSTSAPTTSHSTTSTSPLTSASSTATTSGYIGCIADSSSARAITGAAYSVQGKMTPAYCKGLCSGYTYAGVEYSYQCFCGDSYTNNGRGTIVSGAYCNSACSGNSTEMCGGTGYMGVYTVSS